MASTAQLASRLEGRIISPEDADYESARQVVSAAIDRRPALIIRAAGVEDVQVAVELARETGMELAIRSGGHSNAGHGVSEGGIVLDVGELNGLQIDPENRIAWAGSGLTAGEYTGAAGEHGLATGFGDTGSVGLGGITVHGGIGLLVRKHGLTVDDLLAAELVTADGELIHVDGETEPDLFWALRGGGGNFGVVTRFKLRLHELSSFVGGELILPAEPGLIASFIAEAQAAPDELSAVATVMVAPPMPFLPAEAHGKLILMATMAYAGPADEADRVLAPFRDLATPIADMVRPMALAEIYPPEDPNFRPIPAIRSQFLEGVDLGSAELIADRLSNHDAPMAAVQLRVLGGAMARVPADATAFAYRDKRAMANVMMVSETIERLPERTAWVERVASELNQGDPDVYAGFLGEEGEARVRAAYPPATWERLARIKAQHDPDNLFRVNQNIAPAGGR